MPTAKTYHNAKVQFFLISLATTNPPQHTSSVSRRDTLLHFYANSSSIRWVPHKRQQDDDR